MKAFLCAFFFSFPSLCYPFEEDPWFNDLLEFHFQSTYNYNFFDRVERASPQLDTRFHTHLLQFDLGVVIPPTWNFEMELEWADTTSVCWGYRSFALCARRLWLDDVCGDSLSLTTGLSVRHASRRLRKALSTPYHAVANFEVHTAFGKEWSDGCVWFFRTYGLVALGQGSCGFPWVRGDLILWWNVCDVHHLRIFAKSYWGLGRNKKVILDPFSSWAKVGHQSIDIGGNYTYCFNMWGSLCFDYQYRVYARSYPESAHSFLFSYDLPFSLF